MAQLRWTRQASDDLESITEFIAHDSEVYARFFAMDVLRAVERLADFPASGRIVPETNNPEIRELIMCNYRIVYRIQEKTVELLTIFHGARLLDSSRIV